MKSREMREIAQLPHRENDGFYTKRVRLVSIYVTRLLISVGFTANGTTALMLAVGAFGCLLFTSATALTRFLGALALQSWFVLDCCDGEVARLRRSSTLTGSYLDFLSHFIIHPCIFLCLGAGLFRATGDASILFFAFSSAMASLLAELVQDCRYKAVYFTLRKGGVPAGTAAPPSEGGGISSPARRGLKRIVLFFASLLFLCKVPAVMNLLFLAVLVDFMGAGTGIFWAGRALMLLGTAGHLPWIAFAAETIHYGETEKSYLELSGRSGGTGSESVDR